MLNFEAVYSIGIQEKTQHNQNQQLGKATLMVVQDVQGLKTEEMDSKILKKKISGRKTVIRAIISQIRYTMKSSTAAKYRCL